MKFKMTLIVFFFALMCSVVSSITIEYASLRDFLFGAEPSVQYDRWISHLAEGIALPDYNTYAPYDRQSNGFGSYHTPNTTETQAWDNMLNLFLAGDYDGAQTQLDLMQAPFQIVEFHDTDANNLYYMIREIPNPDFFDDNGTVDLTDDEHGAFTYGWGLFIYNTSATSPVIITIPHPCDDFPSPVMGYQAFTQWNAPFLMINGAGREVAWSNVEPYNNSKSLSDPTRNANHPFHKAYIKFADKIRLQTGWREFSAQLHTYDSNLHIGYANCQISAGYRKDCPNLPIRDVSLLKHDLINQGNHIMVPANTVDNSQDVLLNSFYAVYYNTYPFTFSDDINSYAVNSSIDLPAYSLNNQMLYTQTGINDFDVYEPFFHIEMDELPNVYGSSASMFNWFYGWNAETQAWDMDNLFTNFVSYYGRWIDDMVPVLAEMFNMDDGLNPSIPSNLIVQSQTSTSVTLAWNPSSAYDFETYEILYAFEPIALGNYQIVNRSSIPILASQSNVSITISGLTTGNPYYFRIRAKDKNNNYSELSNEIWVNLQLPQTVFSISPVSKNFGTVVAGTPTTQVFTVANTGTGSLGINSATLTGPGASQFVLIDNNDYPVYLDYNQSIVLTVGFQPNAEGSFTAYLTIIDDLTRNVHNINLSAICTDTPNHGGGDVSSTYGGYYFANSLSISAVAVPSFSWITQTSNQVNAGSVIGNLDDGYWGPIDLSFDFGFYGNLYQQIFVSTNGFLKFGSGASQYNNAQIPRNPPPDDIIALFWDDLEYYTGTSHIYYGGNSSAFVITFDKLGRTGTAYNPLQSVTCQVILFPDGNLKFQYLEVTGSTHSPTVGIENSTGTKGVQYHYNGTGGLYSLGASNPGIAIMFGTNEYTLPVELSAFTAVVTAQNVVILNWTTQTETNLSGFYLYRGQDNTLSNAMRIQSLIAATNTSQEADYIFVDREVEPGNTYYYWLESMEINSESEFHGPINVIIHDSTGQTPLVPVITELMNAYPNPFQPPLKIPYKVAIAGAVKIDVYNIRGQLVWNNETSHPKAGLYQMLWNGSDMHGNPVCTGVYYYRMTCGKYSEIKKTILLK